MKTPRPIVVSFLALAAWSAVAAPSSLLNRSPFAPPAPPAAPQAVQPGRFEYRGLVTIGDQPHFCVVDTTNQKSYWLRMNQVEESVRVTAYDPSRDTVTIEAEGVPPQQAQMKEAQIITAAVPAAPMPMPGPNMPGMPPVAPAPNGTVAPPSEQEIQERRQRIVDELRRRRAARNSQSGTAPAP